MTSNDKNTSSKKELVFFSYLFYSALFILVLRHFSTINEFALNLPYEDDYDAILRFLSEYKTADGGEKMKLLFSQHNEHRIFPARIVYLTYYIINGTVNFRNLIFIGNIQLLIILSIGIYFFKKCFTVFWPIPAFIFALCLFDLNSFGNSNFAMAGMSNYGIIMFFFLALFFLSLDGKKFLYLSVLCQILCFFSNGNGILACFALILYSILDRNRIKTIVCSVVFAVCAVLYFSSYISVSNQMTATELNMFIQYFLRLSGNHFGYEVAFASGIIILGLSFFILPLNKKIQPKPGSLPFLVILLFLLASIGTVSVFRSNNTIQQSYSTRFLIYSNLIASMVFCLVAIRLNNHKLKIPVVLASIILFLIVYNTNFKYGLSNLELQKNRLLYTEFYYPDETEARKITEEACRLDIYCINLER